jgi:hypothetical protein
MSEKLITGFFAIVTLALVLINYPAVESMIKSGGQNVGVLTKGLQGR